MPADANAKVMAADISKLTVAQLKAICKERKIAGYSKLGKPALIQKLADNGYSHSDAPSIAPNIPQAAALDLPQVAPPAETVIATAPASSGPAEPSASSVGIALSNEAGHVSGGAIPTGKASAPKAKSKPRKTAAAKPVAQGTPDTATPDVTATTLSQAAPTAVPQSAVSVGLPLTRNSLVEGSTSGATDAPAVKSSLTKGKKRAQPAQGAMPPPPPKKPRIQPPLSSSRTSSAVSRTQVAAQSTVLPRRPSNTGDVSAPIRAVCTTAKASIPAKPSPIPTAPAKRFKRLVVGTAKPPAARITPARATPPAKSTTTLQLKDTHRSLEYLDFPTVLDELPTLHAITLPPPLAQRKRVARWAVILSGLSGSERAVCALVSRTFRYAVYLSASSVLAKDYRGRRLQDDVLKRYSQAMTNMWPYLRVRKAEVVARRRIYEASFVPRLLERYGPADPISTHLWASPDNPKQIVVAVRFALTRAWFELSVGASSGAKDDPTSWLHATIIDVQEVVQDEIWSVTLEEPQTRRREILFVLEATCEVVGRPLGVKSDDGVAPLPVRADWSAYIANRSAPSSGGDFLLSHLKWSCPEEFDRGLSTLWLKRVTGEGPLGVAKRTVAERYVLACVVGNSISGTWQSTNEMVQDFAGLPARGAAPVPLKTRAPALNLYLPEHHHVESVHFTSSGGNGLHPALATVQTPHREYYILRDNGMQVGCEEDGVAAVWQEVLGCDHRGVPT
ncbi:hypothetical protein VTO73DRAFT_5889 [Trametes versicolor]